MKNKKSALANEENDEETIQKSSISEENDIEAMMMTADRNQLKNPEIDEITGIG